MFGDLPAATLALGLGGVPEFRGEHRNFAQAVGLNLDVAHAAFVSTG
jgi:hypothetical protein